MTTMEKESPEMPDDTYRCSRCLVSHHVVDDYPAAANRKIRERLRCPDCNMAFLVLRKAMENPPISRLYVRRDELERLGLPTEGAEAPC